MRNELYYEVLKNKEDIEYAFNKLGYSVYHIDGEDDFLSVRIYFTNPAVDDKNHYEFTDLDSLNCYLQGLTRMENGVRYLKLQAITQDDNPLYKSLINRRKLWEEKFNEKGYTIYDIINLKEKGVKIVTDTIDGERQEITYNRENRLWLFLKFLPVSEIGLRQLKLKELCK